MVTNGNSTLTYLSYDAFGHPTATQETSVTLGQTYKFAYSYDLAGALTSETYPSGRAIAIDYDSANRVSKLKGTIGSQQKIYANGFNYAPHGQPNWYFYGNNVCRAFTYNNRLQPSGETESVQPSTPGSGNADCTYAADQRLVLSWTWKNSANQNNGNLMWLTASHGGAGYAQPLTFTEAYTYDALNRLLSATDTGGWSRNFNYDQYGNMWTTGATGIPAGGLTPLTANAFNAANNQLTNVSYDASGNQLALGADTVKYDAENRMAGVTGSPVSGGGVRYRLCNSICVLHKYAYDLLI